VPGICLFYLIHRSEAYCHSGSPMMPTMAALALGILLRQWGWRASFHGGALCLSPSKSSKVDRRVLRNRHRAYNVSGPTQLAKVRLCIELYSCQSSIAEVFVGDM